MTINGTMVRKISSWTVYAAVFLIVLELCARIDDRLKYGAPFFGEYTDERLRSFDDEGVRYNIPNISFEKWHHNDLGFRGPDIDLKKPDTTTRIVCMGTSETYGLYESPGNEWPAQLSGQLNRTGHFDVINAATVGLKRIHYLKYLKKYVYRLDPDIVVLVIFPSFEKAAPPAETITTETSVIQATPEESNNLTLESLKPSFRILPKAWQVVKRFVPNWMLERYQYWNRLKQIRDLERRYLKGQAPLDRIPTEDYAGFKTDIEQVVRDLKSRGTHVVLTTYPFLMNPHNLDKYPLIFMEARRFAIELSYEGMMDACSQGNRLIRQIAREENTGLVDLYLGIPQDTVHLADNVHLTDEGARLAAELVAKYITANFVR
ncbi:MAG: hypothetical protein AB1483_00875 [Candidatus Zixiibacteriota bacterium]